MELIEKLKTICKVCLFLASVGKCANSSQIENKSGIHIWSGGQVLNSTDVLAVKIGTSLVINCSIDLGTNDNSTTIQSRAGSQLSIRQYNNTFIQYGNDVVNWSLNGSVFWCGYRQNINGNITENRKEITIVIGDTPSPPRLAEYSIHGIQLYIVKISWKPAIYTGHLPAFYEVSYTTCRNQSYCFQQPILFCRTPHVDHEEQFTCQMERDELMIIMPVEDLSDIIRFSIVTVNAVDKSKSISFLAILGYGSAEEVLMPTPLPPKNLHAVALNSNQIKVTWTANFFRRIVYLYIYKVFYHAEKDIFNKTVTITNEDSVIIMDGILPFTRYKIYLLKKVKVRNGNGSATSEMIGPVDVMTMEGDPKEGPAIKSLQSVVFPNDADIRNVTLVWKQPAQSSWQGKPSNIILTYKENRYGNFSEQVIPITGDEIPQNTTIIGLKSSNSYETYLKLCNKHSCGSMGPEKTIGPINKKGTEVIQNNDENLSIAMSIIGVVVTIFAILLISFLFHKWWNRKRPKVSMVPLDELVDPNKVDPDYVGPYCDLGDPGLSDYSVAIVTQQMDDTNVDQSIHDAMQPQIV